MKKNIHRWVEMHFQPSKIEEFLTVFESSKEKIRARAGCLSLQLIQDPTSPNILCTSSIWDSEESLNDYRNSELFKDTWAKTKPLFHEKAKAKTFTLLDWQP